MKSKITIALIIVAILVFMYITYRMVKHKQEKPVTNDEILNDISTNSGGPLSNLAKAAVNAVKSGVVKPKGVYSAVDNIKLYSYNSLLSYIQVPDTYKKETLIGQQTGYADDYRRIEIKTPSGKILYAFINDVKVV